MVLAKVDLRVNMVERYFRRVDKRVTGQERDVPIEMGAHFGYRLVNDRPEHSFLEPEALGQTIVVVPGQRAAVWLEVNPRRVKIQPFGTGSQFERWAQSTIRSWRHPLSTPYSTRLTPNHHEQRLHSTPSAGH